MKKYLAICLVLVLALGVFVGCGQKEEYKSIEGLKQAYKDAGFEVGEDQEVMFSMISAVDGVKLPLNGKIIEIYKFDMNNLDNKAKKIVDGAKKGKTEFFGMEFDAKYNGGLVILNFEKHEDKDKIIEVFEKY